jgi:hypothetical protein
MNLDEHVEELAGKYTRWLEYEELTQREYDALMGGLRDLIAELGLEPTDFPAEKGVPKPAMTHVIVGGELRKVSCLTPIRVGPKLMELREYCHNAGNGAFYIFDGTEWVEARLDSGFFLRVSATLPSHTDPDALRDRLRRHLSRVATDVLITIE